MAQSSKSDNLYRIGVRSGSPCSREASNALGGLSGANTEHHAAAAKPYGDSTLRRQASRDNPALIGLVNTARSANASVVGNKLATDQRRRRPIPTDGAAGLIRSGNSYPLTGVVAAKPPVPVAFTD